jgi:hypothetical protein
MSTYLAEAAALEDAYTKAVGWAIQYGILVYVPDGGGLMKTLGDLRDEIYAYELEHGIVTAATRHNLRHDGQTQAYCRNGHPATVWGSPMVARPGEQVRWYGSPFLCRCGAEIYGGYRL